MPCIWAFLNILCARRINDFSIAKIRTAVGYGRKYEKKIYATLNIFPGSSRFKNLEKHIGSLKDMEVDGVILSDPGVLALVKKVWPKANIHLSTQANCINAQAAKFWENQGVKRVILGREATLKDIREIRRACPDLELEYFVHGAMCMAYSGRCFLSKHLSDRSANEGDCAQPCRWKYDMKSQKSKVPLLPNPWKAGPRKFAMRCGVKSQKYNTDADKYFIQPEGRNEIFVLVEDRDASYILNSQDLCLIKHLDKLAGAGITAFKIEGRTKSVYYAGMAVGIYRKAIEALLENARKYKKISQALYKELDEKLYNRGLCEGFLLGKGGLSQNLENSHNIPDWEFCGQVIRRQKAKGRMRKEGTWVRVHNSLFVGDEIEIIKPYYDIIKMKIAKMTDSETGEDISRAHGGRGQSVIIE